MSCLEAESVCKYLKSREITLSPNNIWLISCIRWYNSHLELENVYGSLQEYVCIQWLLADLQDVQHACLPTICRDGKVELTGKYTVQINWVRNIGESCYTQLKATQKIHLSESNDNVSTDEPKIQNWEPKSKRVLMMEVTDGITILQAMEYSPIAKLAKPYLPGFKILLTGPIECRKGILFLTNNNISLLGGEVSHLYEMNSEENLLSRCLNLTTNSNAEQDRSRSGIVSNSSHSHNIAQTNCVQPLVLPHSTTTNQRSNILEGRDMLMSDEDDDFLGQLPDEVLDCVDNIVPEPNMYSPVLDERLSESNREMTSFVQEANNELDNQRSPVFENKSLGMSKHKSFPLEELRAIEKETIPTLALKRSPLSTLPKDLPISKSDLAQTSYASSSCSTSSHLPINYSNISSKLMITNEREDMTLDMSFGNSPTINDSYGNNTLDQQKIVEIKLPQNKGYLQRDKNIMSYDEQKYPQLKKHRLKVESITKLKIRSGEWYCCATVHLEDKFLTVTFSNQVLEKLFGISASEVEVWRTEMATNPPLKKKVNDILKAGQTKLKILNGIMTVNYSSEDCIPHVVAIDLM